MVKYFAVHTQIGRENKAKDSIVHRAHARKLWQNTIFEVICPTQKEFQTKNGTRKIVDKKIFSGYVFVKCDLDQDTEKLIYGSDCVSGFVRSGTKVVPLSENEVTNLLKSMEEAEEQAPKSAYKPKDTILVIDGVFKDFTGIVESIDDAKGKIKAYLQMFGKETITELDSDCVELYV